MIINKKARKIFVERELYSHGFKWWHITKNISCKMLVHFVLNMASQLEETNYDEIKQQF